MCQGKHSIVKRMENGRTVRLDAGATRWTEKVLQNSTGKDVRTTKNGSHRKRAPGGYHNENKSLRE